MDRQCKIWQIKISRTLLYLKHGITKSNFHRNRVFIPRQSPPSPSPRKFYNVRHLLIVQRKRCWVRFFSVAVPLFIWDIWVLVGGLHAISSACSTKMLYELVTMCNYTCLGFIYWTIHHHLYDDLLILEHIFSLKKPESKLHWNFHVVRYW